MQGNSFLIVHKVRREFLGYSMFESLPPVEFAFIQSGNKSRAITIRVSKKIGLIPVY